MKNYNNLKFTFLRHFSYRSYSKFTATDLYFFQDAFRNSKYSFIVYIVIYANNDAITITSIMIIFAFLIILMAKSV